MTGAALRSALFDEQVSSIVLALLRTSAVTCCEGLDMRRTGIFCKVVARIVWVWKAKSSPVTCRTLSRRTSRWPRLFLKPR